MSLKNFVYFILLFCSACGNEEASNDIEFNFYAERIDKFVTNYKIEERLSNPNDTIILYFLQRKLCNICSQENEKLIIDSVIKESSKPNLTFVINDNFNKQDSAIYENVNYQVLTAKMAQFHNVCFLQNIKCIVYNRKLIYFILLK